MAVQYVFLCIAFTDVDLIVLQNTMNTKFSDGTLPIENTSFSWYFDTGSNKHVCVVTYVVSQTV